MAAEMAVESTAQETDLTEDSQVKEEHLEASVLEGHSVKAQKEEALAEIVQEDRSVKEDHSVKTLSAQEEHLVRIQKEEALEETVQEDLSEKTPSVQEDHSARVLREEVLEVTVLEDLSEKTPSVQEDHSARVLKEEDSVEESQLEEVSTQQRRASTRAISTISVMRRKAESTR